MLGTAQGLPLPVVQKTTMSGLSGSQTFMSSLYSIILLGAHIARGDEETKKRKRRDRVGEKKLSPVGLSQTGNIHLTERNV